MITGFNITKIESKVYEYTKFNNISINHELSLKNPGVVVQNTPFGDKNVLRMEYQLSINYLNPSIGYMIFSGISDYTGDDNLASIKDNWDNASDMVTNKVKNEVSNMIFSNIIPFAMLMSSRMGLPPILPLPRINFGIQKEQKQEPQNYIG